MNTQAIAQHLNIVDSAIIEVQEWASVLWVKFIGGCRFVSKKIAGKKTMNIDKLAEVGSRWQKGGNDRIYFNQEFIFKAIGLRMSFYKSGNVSSASLNGEEISNGEAKRIWGRINDSKIWYDVLEGKFLSTGKLTEAERKAIVNRAVALAA